jgi:hypothetical protein
MCSTSPLPIFLLHSNGDRPQPFAERRILSVPAALPALSPIGWPTGLSSRETNGSETLVVSTAFSHELEVGVTWNVQRGCRVVVEDDLRQPKG